MAGVIVFFFFLHFATPETLVYFTSRLRPCWPCASLGPCIDFIVNFAFCWSSVDTPTICLSFVGS